MIVHKHKSKDNDNHFEFVESEEIVVIGNPNSVRAFNCFEEKDHAERYKCHFRFIDLKREDLYYTGLPTIEE